MLYIDNWSILLDIKIILLTIKVVLFGSGAK
ncbi:MAG: sugar transferase [Succinivibrio sp.]|nr:sugar transferase [Succinivibrio sp.]